MDESKDEMMLHQPDPTAHPAKSALVTDKKKKNRKAVTLTWDEHQIEEHDQLRGTRMKIDEPNTPYAYASDHHSDSEASVGSHQSKEKHLNWSHLENKLGAVAAAREGYPSSPSVSSYGGNSSGPDSDGERDKRRKKMKAKEFEMHRKNHYNEFEAMRKWRNEYHDNDDDEDDE